MVNKRPGRGAFRYVYPFPRSRRASRTTSSSTTPTAAIRLDYAPALAEIERWQGLAGSTTLRSFDRGDGVTIVTDTRPCATEFQRRLLLAGGGTLRILRHGPLAEDDSPQGR